MDNVKDMEFFSRLGIWDFRKFWACMDFNDKTLCGKRLVLVKAGRGSCCTGFTTHRTARTSTTRLFATVL